MMQPYMKATMAYMLTKRFVSGEVRKTIILKDHGSRLGRVGGIISMVVDGRCALDRLVRGQVHLRHGQTGHRIKHRTDSRRQGLRLGEQSMDMLLVVAMPNLAAREQVIRTKQTSQVSDVDIEKVDDICRLAVWGQPQGKGNIDSGQDSPFGHIREVDRGNMSQLGLNHIGQAHDDGRVDAIDHTSPPAKEIIGVIVGQGQQVVVWKSVLHVRVPLAQVRLFDSLGAWVMAIGAGRETVLDLLASMMMIMSSGSSTRKVDTGQNHQSAREGEAHVGQQIQEPGDSSGAVLPAFIDSTSTSGPVPTPVPVPGETLHDPRKHWAFPACRKGQELESEG